MRALQVKQLTWSHKASNSAISAQASGAGEKSRDFCKIKTYLVGYWYNLLAE